MFSGLFRNFALSGRKKSEPKSDADGTRTRNLRIDSPVL